MSFGGVVDDPRVLTAPGELPFGCAQPLRVELALQGQVDRSPSDLAGRGAVTLPAAHSPGWQRAGGECLLGSVAPVRRRRVVAEEVGVGAPELLLVGGQVEDPNRVFGAVAGRRDEAKGLGVPPRSPSRG
jgi:hypothetical protein